MIYLITGLPGAGKTLYGIQVVLERAKKEGRSVYVDGLDIVDNVTLPWLPFPEGGWQHCPTGAIIFIDEAQRRYRPRGHGSAVPAEVAAFETHRHSGFDIYMTTQQPMLLDSNVRRLVGNHLHVMRKFGAQSAVVHEFPTGIRDNPDKVRTDSVRHNWSYPKKLYAAYNSAEAHTHKFKLPMRVWLMFLIPVALAPVFYYGGKWFYDSAHGKVTAPYMGEASKVNEGTIHYSSGAGSSAGQPVVSAADYIKQRVPVLPDIPASAPVYQSIVKPTIAPRVAACIASETKCVCYSQQGTTVSVSQPFCRSFSEKPIFVDYQEEKPIQERREGTLPPLSRQPEGVGSLSNPVQPRSAL